MTLRRPLYMQAAEGDTEITYSGQDYRLLVASLLSEGVVGPGDLVVTQRGAGTNFSVDIAPGTVVIAGDAVAEQGSYLCRSDGIENRAVPEPPGAGSRTHRVVARVYDHLHDNATSDYEWALEVLPDTGDGTPATPPSAVSLALVTVAVGQTDVDDGDIVPTRPFAGVGGVAARRVALLTADEDPVTNNDTPVDTDLVVELPANIKCEVRATIIYTAGAGDLKIDVTGPTGFGCDLTAHGPATAATSVGDGRWGLLLASPSSASFGGAGGTTALTAYLHGHLYSGAGGQVRIRGAQATSNAEATRIRAQSLFICDPFS